MGWNSQVVIATLVIIEGNDDGLFVYNGTPANGNLIATIVAGPGTDPDGNQYLGGITAYDSSSDAGQLEGIGLQVTNGGHLVGKLQYSSAAAAFYLEAFQGFSQLMTDALTAVEPGSSPAALETWHALALDTGWTAGSGSNPVPSYRVMPDGGVQISGYATHTSFSGSLNLCSGANVLPAAYRPTTNQFFAAYTATGACGMVVQPSGQIVVQFAPAASTDIRFCSPSLPVNL